LSKIEILPFFITNHSNKSVIKKYSFGSGVKISVLCPS
jgi:hypothetical protein